MKRILPILLLLSFVVFSFGAALWVPNVGSSANDGTGTSLRSAFQMVNSNNFEILKFLNFTNYNVTGNTGAFNVLFITNGGTVSHTATNAGSITFTVAGPAGGTNNLLVITSGSTNRLIVSQLGDLRTFSGIYGTTQHTNTYIDLQTSSQITFASAGASYQMQGPTVGFINGPGIYRWRQFGPEIRAANDSNMWSTATNFQFSGRATATNGFASSRTNAPGTNELRIEGEFMDWMSNSIAFYRTFRSGTNTWTWSLGATPHAPLVAAAPTLGTWVPNTDPEFWDIDVTMPAYSTNAGTGPVTMKLQYSTGESSTSWSDATESWSGVSAGAIVAPSSVVTVDARSTGEFLKFRVVQSNAAGSTIGTATAETTVP